jgi:nitroreductase
MDVIDAIKQRHSTRAYLSTTVSNKLIETILSVASYSPSGANTQPWQVAVLTGSSKERLQTMLESAFESGIKPNPDYQYYPTEWKSPFTERRKACGLQLYQSLGISIKNSEARKAQWKANYRAFDAPVLLLLFMDESMKTGSYLDYGMFMQSIMLVAQSLGLATCPQAAFADYPDIVRKELGYVGMNLIAGMALGYEDTDAAVNQYRTEREPLENFSRFFD